MFTTNEFADGKPRRVPRWVLPIVVVVVVLVVAVIAWRVIERPDAGTATSSTTTPVGPDPVTAPKGIEWRQVNGVKLPFGIDGPTRTDGPRAVGFAHSPQGAVLAAWQISTRVMTDNRFEQILNTQVRADLNQQQQIRDAVTQVRNFDSTQFAMAFPAPIGFRVEFYSPSFARIYFAVPSAKNGGYDFERRAVLWDRGDWQYQADSDLPLLPNATTLTGFTTF